MKIFISHYRHTDYEQELYAPLRASALITKHEFILPHMHGEFVYTKEDVRTCDIVFAEVSQSVTGVGIEIGWANAYGKPVVCMVKSGKKLSNSLQFITKDFIEYTDSTDLIVKMEAFLAKMDI